MPINHSFQILNCNIKLVAKVAIFILIIGLIFSGIFYAILNPIITELTDLITGINIDADSFINHPINTTRDYIIQPIVEYLGSKNIGSVVGWFIGLFVVIKLLITIPILPVSKIVYTKMTTGYDIGLLNSTVSTGFQNILLSAILTIITSILDGGITIAIYELFMVCLNAKLIFLLPFILILGVCLLTIRMSLFCQIAPNIASLQLKNIFIGIGNAYKGTMVKFRKNFLCILVLNIFWITIMLITAIPTLFAVPILCVPLYMVHYCIMSNTLFCSYHQQNYFIDNGTTVYTPTKIF